MKACRIILLSLGVLSAHPLTGGAQPRITAGSAYCAQRHIEGNAFAPARVLQGGPAHAYDVVKYSLALDIYHCYATPFPRSFSGYELVTFLVDSSLGSVTLDAANNSLVVDSVTLGASGFTHANDILTLNLDRTHSPGDTVHVGIFYRHKDVIDAAFYVGTDGMVFTDCEPQGARKWFPCWDRPSDKALWDLTAIVPSTVKLGSNGHLADSTTRNDTTTFHWISRDPVATYLMVLTSRVGYNLDIVEWPKISNPADSIPIRFYWNTGESNLGHIESIIVPMTTRYSQLFGEHPFEKNGFATLNSSFPWGGMENQTLTSLCPNCWDESLVSHEFAHQWFGDMITCGTWADVWLNEGFATYCEALWIETTGGPASYASSIANDASYYLGANPGWPIYNPTWAVLTPSDNILFNYAITYIKGACVLHMLRYVLGDSVFFSAMKAYATDPAYKFKSTVTADFASKMSQTTGQDLSWFFNEWVYQPNHPVYHNTYSIDSLGSGAWQVTFHAVQTQPNPAFFTMPLELKVSFTIGQDSLIRVMNDANNQVYSFTFSRKPSALQFDPNNGIVLKQGGISDVAESAGLPGELSLEQNFPNPFNPTTDIRFTIPAGAIHETSLRVYDILGREVAVLVNERKNPGTYTVAFDAGGLASGVYFYRLTAGSFDQTRRMLLLR